MQFSAWISVLRICAENNMNKSYMNLKCLLLATVDMFYIYIHVCVL